MDPAVVGALAGELPLRPALAGGSAVDPVGAVEPGVVEEADGGEQVALLAVLQRGGLRFDARALALQVERLRLHVDVLAVAAEDVWQRDRHVLPSHHRLQVVLGAGDLVVHHVLRQQFAGLGIEPDHPQPAVEEHRPSGHAVQHVVLN